MFFKHTSSFNHLVVIPEARKAYVQMSSTPEFLFIITIFVLSFVFVKIGGANFPIAKPKCQDSCGGVSIPYPFGIGENCCKNKWFEIICKNDFNNSFFPILSVYHLKIANISDNELLVLHNWTFSSSYPGKSLTELSIGNGDPGGYNKNDWFYRDAYVAEDGFFSTPNYTEVPMKMKWRLSDLPCQDWQYIGDLARSRSCGDNAHCIINDNALGGLCMCDDGFIGNPYLPSGCIDVDECREGTFKCGNGALCNNTPGSYSCYCQHGHRLLPDRSCIRLAVAFIVAVAMAGTVLCVQKLKRKKECQLRRMFFKRNGGLLLEQQISSQEDSVLKTQIFELNELERATDNFSEHRMCGKGGFGAVYKGMLHDGRMVAIKRSHIIDEKLVAQFINEVVILSRINHRNIVKLLGCCLETEVPLLVYEFIGNGNLSQLLHDKDSNLSISWEVRVKVGLEIAGALAYMHSAVCTPIFHRDVKSSNILVDDNYNAKLSDFGISRSIPIEKSHLTTTLQGTFGYLDPEYFHSSQFTEKSDVYSFGVVLMELLTGEKAVSKTKVKVEEKSLVLSFKLAMKEDRLFDILDPYVRDQGRKEDIVEFAKLAKKCVKLNGKRRPTMKEVAAVIEKIIKFMKVLDNANEDVDSQVSSTILSTGLSSPVHYVTAELHIE